jgi:hypothetical protein
MVVCILLVAFCMNTSSLGSTIIADQSSVCLQGGDLRTKAVSTCLLVILVRLLGGPLLPSTGVGLLSILGSLTGEKVPRMSDLLRDGSSSLFLS